MIDMVLPSSKALCMLACNKALIFGNLTDMSKETCGSMSGIRMSVELRELRSSGVIRTISRK